MGFQKSTPKQKLNDFQPQSSEKCVFIERKNQAKYFI